MLQIAVVVFASGLKQGESHKATWNNGQYVMKYNLFLRPSHTGKQPPVRGTLSICGQGHSGGGSLDLRVDIEALPWFPQHAATISLNIIGVKMGKKPVSSVETRGHGMHLKAGFLINRKYPTLRAVVHAKRRKDYKGHAWYVLRDLMAVVLLILFFFLTTFF